jgi:hypothetical protein
VEWQGGPPRLGFDVACYSRKTDEELWRVVFEGFNKRLKVYPDGRTERFDGEGNFPAWQNKGKPPPEYLQITPSRDRSKIDAAVCVFERFAAESVSHTALAHYLNKLGHRTAQGNLFVGYQIAAMLEDPIYLGFYTYNRVHFGKFHRWTEGQAVLELNYDEKQSKNDKADWVQSHKRLFDPLVDRPTWDAVQKKLAGTTGWDDRDIQDNSGSLGRRAGPPRHPRISHLGLAQHRVTAGDADMGHYRLRGTWPFGTPVWLLSVTQE